MLLFYLFIGLFNIQHVTTLHNSLLHIHSIVHSHVFSSRCLVAASGRQLRTFPFLCVSELFPCLSYSNSTVLTDSPCFDRQLSTFTQLIGTNPQWELVNYHYSFYSPVRIGQKQPFQRSIVARVTVAATAPRWPLFTESLLISGWVQLLA
jgi:hypothetical protein